MLRLIIGHVPYAHDVTTQLCGTGKKGLAYMREASRTRHFECRTGMLYGRRHATSSYLAAEILRKKTKPELMFRRMARRKVVWSLPKES